MIELIIGIYAVMWTSGIYVIYLVKKEERDFDKFLLKSFKEFR